jgi:hypothetical protein
MTVTLNQRKPAALLGITVRHPIEAYPDDTRSRKPAIRSHISGGLEYMGKCPLSGTSAISTPQALRCAKYERDAFCSPPAIVIGVRYCHAHTVGIEVATQVSRCGTIIELAIT